MRETRSFARRSSRRASSCGYWTLAENRAESFVPTLRASNEICILPRCLTAPAGVVPALRAYFGSQPQLSALCSKLLLTAAISSLSSFAMRKNGVRGVVVACGGGYNLWFARLPLLLLYSPPRLKRFSHSVHPSCPLKVFPVYEVFAFGPNLFV